MVGLGENNTNAHWRNAFHGASLTNGKMSANASCTTSNLARGRVENLTFVAHLHMQAAGQGIQRGVCCAVVGLPRGPQRARDRGEHHRRPQRLRRRRGEDAGCAGDLRRKDRSHAARALVRQQGILSTTETMLSSC